MTEEILNALVKMRGLQVASRTSSFAFKGKEIEVREVGDRLNAATVLEGSVRKSLGVQCRRCRSRSPETRDEKLDPVIKQTVIWDPPHLSAAALRSSTNVLPGDPCTPIGIRRDACSSSWWHH